MKVEMKELHTFALASTAVVVLASCATTSSNIAFNEEATSKTDAIVYIYRVSNFVGSAVSFTVKVDGKEVAQLKQNAYVVFHVTPGDHVIAVGDSIMLAWAITQAVTEKSRTFTAVPSGVYYLRSVAGVTFLVTKEEAMKEIVTMKYDMGL